jgi:hypothetical protein
VHKRIISAVKRVEFLRGRRFDIIVLNVYVQTEDNSDDVKDSFYEELEYVFDTLPK